MSITLRDHWNSEQMFISVEYVNLYKNMAQK